MYVNHYWDVISWITFFFFAVLVNTVIKRIRVDYCWWIYYCCTRVSRCITAYHDLFSLFRSIREYENFYYTCYTITLVFTKLPVLSTAVPFPHFSSSLTNANSARVSITEAA